MMMIRLSIGLAALLVGLSAHGEWEYKEVVNTAGEMWHHAIVMGEYKGTMSFRCRSDLSASDLLLEWAFKNVYRMTGELVDVTYRWDDWPQPDEYAKMSRSYHGDTVILRVLDEPLNVSLWAVKAATHYKLRIQFEGYGVFATYTMKGAKDAIRKVLTACGIEGPAVLEREPTITLSEGVLDRAALEVLIEALDEEQRAEFAKSVAAIMFKHIPPFRFDDLSRAKQGEVWRNIGAELEGKTAEQVIEHAKPLPPWVEVFPSEGWAHSVVAFLGRGVEDLD